MKRRTAASILLLVGIALLLYAMLFMDVTADGRIINLNLLSLRQNLVIVGSVATMAGLILMYSGTSDAQQSNEKSSQTPISKPTKSESISHLSSVVRFLSLGLIPIGAWMIYRFLFGTAHDSPFLLLPVGALFYFAPILAHRSLLAELHPSLRSEKRITVIAFAALIPALVVLGFIDRYYY